MSKRQSALPASPDVSDVSSDEETAAESAASSSAEPGVSGIPQSSTPGVCWITKNGKWCGSLKNPLKRTPSGGRKNEHTSPTYFLHEADAVAALAVLRARIDAEMVTHVTELAAADPKFDGIQLGPEHAAEVEAGVVYYRPNKLDDHKPFLVVRVGQKKVKWDPACQHSGCTTKAVQAVKGAAKEFCGIHGGRCPHGRHWTTCRECNPNVTQMMTNCSSCAITLNVKRHRSKGGSGLCAACDARAAADTAALAAAAQGLPPPPPPKKAKLSKEHENKMLERLIMNGYHNVTGVKTAPGPGEFVREAYFDYRCALAREFVGDEKKFGRVDFVVHPKRGGRLVFLEIDENEHHRGYAPILCETTRMWNVTTSLELAEEGVANVLWLRVNPNTQFKIGSVLHKSTNTQRADAVCALLDSIEGKPTDERMAVAYACYQMDADCNALVTSDPDYHPRVRDGVLRLEHSVGVDGSIVFSF
jgi:hypothetical protein